VGFYARILHENAERILAHSECIFETAHFLHGKLLCRKKAIPEIISLSSAKAEKFFVF